MAKLELSEETKAGMTEVGQADLLIAVAAPVDADQLRVAAGRALAAGSVASLRTVVAYPGMNSADAAARVKVDLEPTEAATSLRFLPYSPPSADPARISWLAGASVYQGLLSMARELGVSACAVIGFDLAALDSSSLAPMVAPVIEGRCDLAMPLYALGKFDGLLNSAILAPLNRSLYGRRVRYPLAPDFCLSGTKIPEVEVALQRAVSQGQPLFWPATEAALRDYKMCQVHVGTSHAPPADGVDLSTILAQTVGSLFLDVNSNASIWQRVRGSQAVETLGSAVAPPSDGPPANTTPMVETFQLGFRNLQEVWSLVLPPVTLLELKRLARPSTERFHMPDELWVRVVYDFALAYRLRTISRAHLLGALTPLYLGWVASYALEVGNAGPAEADQRLERLARAYEEGKPYLLSRWRWPDRFNP
jgi:glucosylglycerate synthase